MSFVKGKESGHKVGVTSILGGVPILREKSFAFGFLWDDQLLYVEISWELVKDEVSTLLRQSVVASCVCFAIADLEILVATRRFL